MGFLKKLGSGLVDIATTLIPGGIDDAIVAGIRGTSGGGSRGSLASGNQLIQPPNMGTPPLGIPGGTYFPDIPYLPDFADVEQFFRGQNVMSDGGSGGNGLAQTTQQLVGSNQIVMEPGKKTINTAPPGYVVVTLPSGQKKAVLKSVARKFGLWKPRSKPPITASDWKKLKRAEQVKKKAKKIAQTADFKVTKK
jgi:hypothetical protein